TRPTLWIRKDQEHVPSPELLERDGSTMDIRQIEIRRRSAGLETFTLNTAFTERKLSKCGLLRLRAICGCPRESHHLSHPCSQRLRYLSLLIQQICRRRAAVFEHFLAYIFLRHGILQQQDRTVQPVFVSQLPIGFGIAIADQYQLGVVLFERGLHPDQLRRRHVAKAAVGAPIDQQETAASKLRKRSGLAG